MKFTEKYIQKRALRIPFTECWIWDGYCNKAGYGTTHPILGTTLVHRAIYQEINGVVGKGIYVCHKCDTPSCFNPEHLFAGTSADNAQDRAKKGRSSPRHGDLSGRAKLNAGHVGEIRKLISDGVFQSEIANKFQVDQTTISRIAKGASWRNHYG